MPHSPESHTAPTSKTDYPSYQTIESSGQEEGRISRFEELYPVLQAHFGSSANITVDNFGKYYDSYVKALLTARGTVK